MFVFESATGACFSSMAKVKIENGRSVPMAQLEIGDQVQTGKKSLVIY